MANRTTRAQQQSELAENPVFQEVLKETMNAVVPEGYVEEQISFPPYWKPDLGKGWRGTVIARDQRDPTFHRYIIESAITLDCRKGPVDDGEIITITPGMNFSIGVYAALPLERFEGLEVAVIAMSTRRLPGNEASENKPRDLWEFKTLVSPQVKALLVSRRQEDMAYLKEAQKVARRKMLEELARSNSNPDAVRSSIMSA